jgi:hypothetical protein
LIVGGAFLNSGASVASGAIVAAWIIAGFVVARAVYDMNYKEAKKYNDAVYRPQKATWDRSIMCMRCGTIADGQGVANADHTRGPGSAPQGDA